jgi:hypothetical protein
VLHHGAKKPFSDNRTSQACSITFGLPIIPRHRIRSISYSASLGALCRGRRCRRETVTTHDFRQSCSVRWTTNSRVYHLSGFAEIFRTDRRWCDHAECFRVLDSVVYEKGRQISSRPLF